ncbi:MAG: peptidylprolyl isomerase [Lentisphaeraceae bacterium]|nr:peptidylprolyl isomerase [Lentisphaeraceae bacterium]
MKVTKDAAITIEFVMKNQEGEVVDTTADEPLVYLHGHENIMPALEAAIDGLAVGDAFTAELSVKESFGEKDEELVYTATRADFEEEVLEVGMDFDGVDEDGELVIATVISIEGDDIIMDENHPLAGMALSFEGKVLEVRAATEEELEHGHIHGHGGCEGEEHVHDENCSH